jgi:protein gp37
VAIAVDFVGITPLLDSLDGIETRTADIVVSPGQSSLPVRAIAFNSDGVESVTARVLSGGSEILADDRSTEDLTSAL